MAAATLTSSFAVAPLLADKGPTWYGIDCSWAFTFNIALLKNWIWGKDIVYTYGPLGFLATRIGYHIPSILLILFDAFLMTNFFIVFNEVLNKSKDKFLAVLFIICNILLIRIHTHVGVVWIILFFNCYWLNKAAEKFSFNIYLYLSFLITASFYLKLNTGLIGIILYIMLLLFLNFLREITFKQTLSVLFLPFVFILAVSFPLHVDLPGYLSGAGEHIKGYQAIMGLNCDVSGWNDGMSIIFGGVILLLIYYSIFLVKQKKYSGLLYISVSAIYIFVLRKQAVIRSDEQHMMEFFAYAPLVLLIQNRPFTSPHLQTRHLKISLLIALGCLLLKSSRISISEVMLSIVRTPKNYINSFRHRNSIDYFGQANKRHIPERVLKAINRNTVDIFPWDIQYLLQNRLNYQPRPVFQSFSAYTPYLQNLNLEFYRKHPPEFIIYDYDAIDSRYPFNDECLLNLFIIKNYEITDTFSSNERWRLLLKRKKKNSDVGYTKIKQEKIKLNKVIRLPDNCSFVKIFVKHTMKGMYRNLADKLPLLHLDYKKDNDEWISYRTSSELLEGGAFTGKIVLHNSDFASLFTESEILESISAIIVNGDSEYYESEAQIEYYTTDIFTIKNIYNSNHKTTDLVFDQKCYFNLDNKRVIALWGDPIESNPVFLKKGRYKLSVIQKGTPVTQIYPQLCVFINNKKTGDISSTSSYTNSDYEFEVDSDREIQVKIVMTNDLSVSATGEDRNTFFRNITITPIN
ncbi:MAG: hypothetical protein K1X81_04165 [Bacteroidia bacterium]|nr:hypothetical protein [Bacteroidia bacterium]